MVGNKPLSYIVICAVDAGCLDNKHVHRVLIDYSDLEVIFFLFLLVDIVGFNVLWAVK